MPRHILTRNAGNLPACTCGFGPDVCRRSIEAYSGQNIALAKTAVLDHIDGVRDLPTRLPQPSDPFDVGADRAYPRAGVRRQPDGRWRLTLWDAPDVFHVIEASQRDYPDPYSAFSLGHMLITEHRRNGTRLNGRAA
ncbi:hypothetical protein V1638_04135 [Pseudarthrobacter sp. J64]|uniref:hypothetical protein n=1 Tax=Pseudarthrobacter sp. J64 TaxID=3116485 RepID=UPI002E7FFEF9|nr:hypothetical protein [Pseudarthrobacter sp. J64]MEE2568586.1 hypothetical protein [Pseudarthrobacter sp. J64]